MILGTLAKVAGTELRPEGENPAARQIQKTAREIWAGESGGFKIRWTARDIQIHPVKSPNRVIFSARSLAQQEFARFQASKKKHGLGKRFCEVVCNYKILSIVNSIMSFFEGEGIDCEKTAHPSDTSRFTTLDLKKPGNVSQKRVKLTDYFPKSAIYQALMAEPRVRQALARREPPLPRSPRNLAELYAAFKDVDLPGRSGETLALLGTIRVGDHRSEETFGPGQIRCPDSQPFVCYDDNRFAYFETSSAQSTAMFFPKFYRLTPTVWCWLTGSFWKSTAGKSPGLRQR